MRDVSLALKVHSFGKINGALKYQTTQLQDHFYYVMDLANMGDLDGFLTGLRQQGLKLSHKQVQRLIFSTVKSFVKLHKMHCVSHKDIHGGNIFVHHPGGAGAVHTGHIVYDFVLADYGMAPKSFDFYPDWRAEKNYPPEIRVKLSDEIDKYFKTHLFDLYHPILYSVSRHVEEHYFEFLNAETNDIFMLGSLLLHYYPAFEPSQSLVSLIDSMLDPNPTTRFKAIDVLLILKSWDNTLPQRQPKARPLGAISAPPKCFEIKGPVARLTFRSGLLIAILFILIILPKWLGYF